MKRNYENEDEIEEEESEFEKRQKIEKSTLDEMRTYLQPTSSKDYDKNIKEITNKYYVEYFKKIFKEIPLCNEIFDIDSIGKDQDSFYKAFSIAKTVINCNLKIKKYIALTSLTNATSSIFGQIFHHNYIVPFLSPMVNKNTLNAAFLQYQTEISKDTEPDKVQCISYIIQTELEEEQPLRIPHPIYGCITNQISASSKYVIKILTDVARTYINQDLSLNEIPAN